MSPVLAELTAVCTLDCEQEAAAMVFAWVGRHQSKTSAMMICIFRREHLRAPQEARLASNWSPRFLPTTGFPHRNFRLESSSVPCTLILKVPPTPTPYSVSFGKTLRILTGSPNLVQVVPLSVGADQDLSSLCITWPTKYSKYVEDPLPRVAPHCHGSAGQTGLQCLAEWLRLSIPLWTLSHSSKTTRLKRIL